jgi:hypothetical protein
MAALQYESAKNIKWMNFIFSKWICENNLNCLYRDLGTTKGYHIELNISSLIKYKRHSLGNCYTVLPLEILKYAQWKSLTP